MGSNVADSLKSELLKAATAYQQNYYEICSDWNRYESDELDYLRDYIGYALYGPPDPAEYDSKNREKDESERGSGDIKKNGSVGKVCASHFLYSETQQKAINVIYEQITKYGKVQAEKSVLCGLMYNVIFNEAQLLKTEQKRIAEQEKATESKNTENQNSPKPINEENKRAECSAQNIQIFPVPVFKVRRDCDTTDKKLNTEKNDSDKSQRHVYYVDNSGRVYHSFQNYLKCNTLPQCTMVLPKDGRYQMDRILFASQNLATKNLDGVATTVWLEIYESPASKVAAKVLKGADIVSTVVTVASMGAGIAAMITPVGAGIALASAVGAGVSGLWAVGRSAQQLADRGCHGESINITDKNALGAWIGIAGGTMGFAATGSGVLLSRAIRAGTTVGRAATIAYDAVLIGNIIVNGVGVGYKSYDMYAIYKEKGEISARDVFFLTAHLFFFCNSVVNIRFAQNMIETSQAQLLKDYEASLRSNRHRKEFQRMARNTRAAGTSDLSSNEEIIRAVNKISNKDEFFQAMVRNRKAFSASGAKASFSDGKVTVNSIMTIDPIEFAKLPKDVRIDIVRGVSTVQPNNTAGVKIAERVNETSYKNFTANNTEILKEFCLKHSNAMIQSAPPKIADFANVLNELRSVQNSALIFIKLLDIAYRILQEIPRDEALRLGDVVASIVQFLWNYLKSNLRMIRPGIFIDDPSARILLDKLVQELWFRVEKKIDEWVQAFKEWLKINVPRIINEPFIKDRPEPMEL